jgi:hypothetical protein
MTGRGGARCAPRHADRALLRPLVFCGCCQQTHSCSPGPRPPPVFRSAICDCLSLNVSISRALSRREILEKYDSNKLFEAYGFGAKAPRPTQPRLPPDTGGHGVGGEGLATPSFVSISPRAGGSARVLPALCAAAERCGLALLRAQRQRLQPFRGRRPGAADALPAPPPTQQRAREGGSVQ